LHTYKKTALEVNSFCRCYSQRYYSTLISKEGLPKGKFVQEICFTVKGQECKEKEPSPGHALNAGNILLKIEFRIT
jgi:hypothetical protein